MEKVRRLPSRAKAWYKKRNKYFFWLIIYWVIEIIGSLLLPAIVWGIDLSYFQGWVYGATQLIVGVGILVLLVSYVVILHLTYKDYKSSGYTIVWKLDKIAYFVIVLMLMFVTKLVSVGLIYMTVKFGTGCDQQIFVDLGCLMSWAPSVVSWFWMSLHCIVILLMLILCLINFILFIWFVIIQLREAINIIKYGNTSQKMNTKSRNYANMVLEKMKIILDNLSMMRKTTSQEWSTIKRETEVVRNETLELLLPPKESVQRRVGSGSKENELLLTSQINVDNTDSDIVPVGGITPMNSSPPDVVYNVNYVNENTNQGEHLYTQPTGVDNEKD